MKKNKKITTIENLAIMIQGEFTAIQKRFDKVDKDIAVLKAEVSSIKYDLEDLKLKESQVAFRYEIQNLEKRLKKVEIELQIK